MTQEEIAPYVDLSTFSTIKEYEKTLSKKRLRNRRRAMRRLEERGSVAFETLSEGIEASKKIEDLLELKRSWMRHSGRVSRALDDIRTDEFFARVAADDVRKTGLVLKSLCCADEIAAMELGFRCKDRYVVHVITYNRSYRKYGGGSILSERSIADLMGSGARTIDFMAPGDMYKFEWCASSVDVLDWAIPLTSRGWVLTHVYLGFLRERLKETLAALPAAIRKSITSMRRSFISTFF